MAESTQRIQNPPPKGVRVRVPLGTRQRKRARDTMAPAGSGGTIGRAFGERPDGSGTGSRCLRRGARRVVAAAPENPERFAGASFRPERRSPMPRRHLAAMVGGCCRAGGNADPDRHQPAQRRFRFRARRRYGGSPWPAPRNGDGWLAAVAMCAAAWSAFVLAFALGRALSSMAAGPSSASVWPRLAGGWASHRRSRPIAYTLLGELLSSVFRLAAVGGVLLPADGRIDTAALLAIMPVLFCRSGDYQEQHPRSRKRMPASASDTGGASRSADDDRSTRLKLLPF